MPPTRKEILDFFIERSFLAKTGILILGAIIIIAGTELRMDYPAIGYGTILAGLLMDWGIVYLVYIEITRMRDEIRQTQSEIEETKAQIDDAFFEIEEAKDMAEGAKKYGGQR